MVPILHRIRDFHLDPRQMVRSPPRWVSLLLAAGLALQIGWAIQRPPLRANAEDLPPPMAVATLRLATLGDPIPVARLLLIWLQGFDNQPGIYVPYRRLDYGRMREWLDQILTLDPRNQYPLYLASRIYAEVPDVPKKQMMIDWVHQRFYEDPGRRWPWLAHVAVITKHQLHDLPQAMIHCNALARLATTPSVPYWVRDMKLYLLRDMGELETAMILAGQLLASGKIGDPDEVRYLTQWIERLQKQAEAARRSDPIPSR